MKRNKFEVKYSYFLILFILASCDAKFPERIGYYKIDYNGNSRIVLLSEDDTYLINGHITDYVYDDTFILIEQNSLDNICECNIDCFEKMDSYDGRSAPRCEEAISKNNVRKYWIVEQQKDFSSSYAYEKHFSKMKENVFGPYSYEEYKRKRFELGVTDKLELKLENTTATQQNL